MGLPEYVQTVDPVLYGAAPERWLLIQSWGPGMPTGPGTSLRDTEGNTFHALGTIPRVLAGVVDRVRDDFTRLVPEGERVRVPTQETTARMLGLDQQMISRILHGTRCRVSPRQLANLVRVALGRDLIERYVRDTWEHL